MKSSAVFYLTKSPKNAALLSKGKVTMPNILNTLSDAEVSQLINAKSPM